METPKPVKVGNLWVFEVSGSAYEIGFQHGRAFSEQIHAGLIPFLAQFLPRVLARSEAPLLQKPVLAYLRARYGNRLKHRMAPRHRDLMRGLAEGAGMDLRQIQDAAVFPELFLALITTLEHVQRHAPVLRTALGCTSAIAGGSATIDGRLYHSRNFDYPAVGFWDRDRVLTFCEPDDGMPFLEVGSAGSPVGGITGVNAAGISICMHQHWVDRIDPNGFVVGVAGDAVLRQATSLDEAIAILLKHPPVSGWTYMVCDGERGQAAAVEVAPGGHGVLRLGDTGTPDTLAYSNVYLSKELGGREFAFSDHYWKNCLWRLERVRELLKKDYGRHTPQTLAAILGDSCSPNRKGSCLLGSTVVSPITVTSVVMDPAARTLWVGDGHAPTPHREFVPFALREKALSLALPRFTIQGAFGSPAAAAAMSDYLAAYRSFFERGDLINARSSLCAATERYPQAAELWLMRAILALRAGDPTDAVPSARRAVQGDLVEPALSDARLALAFALDLEKSSNSESKGLYAEIARNPDASPKTRQLAKRGRILRFTQRRARRLAVDFIYGGLA